MSTHPAEPEEPVEPGTNPGTPNPTRLPVEPEFGPMPPPSEPEDAAGKPHPV